MNRHGQQVPPPGYDPDKDRAWARICRESISPVEIPARINGKDNWAPFESFPNHKRYRPKSKGEAPRP